MARIRTRYGERRLARYFYNGVEQPGFNQLRIGSVEVCSDGLGPKTDHPLTLTRDTWSGGNAIWQGTLQLQGPVAFVGSPGDGDATISSWLSQFTAQRIAAATAPERPSVNNLTNVLEFRDIPKMLKHAGDLLLHLRSPVWLTRPQTIASSILAYQFGWKPLFDDLLRMLDFGDAVARRQQELTDLAGGKEIRKKVKFGSISGSMMRVNRDVHTANGIFISPPCLSKWEAQAWATIHWSLSDQHLLGWKPTWWYAFNSLYGLTPGEIPIQIWKALPWSWAFDWFVNVSQALEVSKNLIDYKPSRINLMWKTQEAESYQKLNPQANRKFDGMEHTRVRLNRVQPSVSAVSGLHLNGPFMDSFKLSVLSSLTILQILRKVRY